MKCGDPCRDTAAPCPYKTVTPGAKKDTAPPCPYRISLGNQEKDGDCTYSRNFRPAIPAQRRLADGNSAGRLRGGRPGLCRARTGDAGDLARRGGGKGGCHAHRADGPGELVAATRRSDPDRADRTGPANQSRPPHRPGEIARGSRPARAGRGGAVSDGFRLGGGTTGQGQRRIRRRRDGQPVQRRIRRQLGTGHIRRSPAQRGSRPGRSGSQRSQPARCPGVAGRRGRDQLRGTARFPGGAGHRQG